MWPNVKKIPACKSGQWKLAIVTVVLSAIAILLGCVLIGCLVWHHQNSWITVYPMMTALAVAGAITIGFALLGNIAVMVQKVKLVWAYSALNLLLVVLLLVLGSSCMSASSASLMSHLTKHWKHSSSQEKTSLQNSFGCCGLDFQNLQQNYTDGHPPCHDLGCCGRAPLSVCCTGHSAQSTDTCPCTPCSQPLQIQTLHAARVAGSLSIITAIFLLFSTMYLLVQTTKRYRKEKNEALQSSEDNDDSAVNYRRF